jgi:Fic family protein
MRLRFSQMSKEEFKRFKEAAKAFDAAHATRESALRTLREEGLLTRTNRLAAPYCEPRAASPKKK